MSYNPYRANRRELTTYSPSTYVGDLKDPIITAALSAGDTLANNWVRKIDGIQYKTNITTSTMSNPLVAASCAFTNGNDLSLADKTLTLVDLQVNEEICRKDIYPTWQGQSGSRVGSNMMRQEFVNHVLELVAAKTAEQVETIIWKGDSTLGVTGFLSNDGVLDSTGFAAGALASATTHEFTSTEVPSGTQAFAAFNAVYNKAATTKPAILAKSDLAFFVSPKTYSFYLYQLATTGGQGYVNQATNQNFDGVTYLGVPVHRCPGMFDDTIVLGQAENLIVGTNAGTDLTQVEFIPVYQYDGSDNVRVVMRMALNTIAGIAPDVVVGYNLV